MCLSLIRTIYYGRSLSKRRVWNPTSMKKHFPDKSRTLAKVYNLQKDEDNYKFFVLDEFLEECDIDQSSLILHGAEKEFILTSDLSVLKKVGLLKKLDSEELLIKNMLKYLEPFPFKGKSHYLGRSNYNESSNFSLKKIRDCIEKEYLAWKFDTDVNYVDGILENLKSSLFIGRSLRSLKRNSDLINRMPSQGDIVYKLYLLTIRPFNLEILLNVKPDLVGIPWDEAGWYCPALMKKSYYEIQVMLDILKSKDFTEGQIQESLPYLTFSVMNLYERLSYLLDSPVSRFRDHKKFLQLLWNYRVNATEKIDAELLSFKQIQRAWDMKIKLIRARKKTHKHFFCMLKGKLAINEKLYKVLLRHPKVISISEAQIKDTIAFLKKKKFTEEEILESITIILYPRQNIEEALKKIEEEEEILAEVGIVNGSVAEENIFREGTKLKKKVLQLCLYYMEKPYHFSGNGVYVMK